MTTPTPTPAPTPDARAEALAAVSIEANWICPDAMCHWCAMPHPDHHSTCKWRTIRAALAANEATCRCGAVGGTKHRAALQEAQEIAQRACYCDEMTTCAAHELVGVIAALGEPR